MQQTLIILIVSAALIVSVLFLFLLTSILSSSIEVSATIFKGQDDSAKIKDDVEDTKLIALHKTNIVPEVGDYHDILSIDINKINDNKILFTIELAGDANKNENYETVYVWLIYYYTTTASALNDASNTEKEFHLYTVIIPSFGAGSNFGNKEERSEEHTSELQS